MLYPNFLTLEECTGVIELTKLKNDFLPGKGKNEKEIWFSDRTAFVNNVPPLIQTITERIATVTHIPTTHAEGLNVVRYNITEGYGFNPHHDYIYGDEWKEHIEKYGNRIATMIIYLNDVEGGGETVFPRINLSIRPKAGTALLFYSLTPDLQLDELTEHASLRVTKGEKWIATRWIRQHVYA
jgi:prolyl 4-hydroxylase